MAEPKQCVINIDLVKIVDAPAKGKFVRVAAWGDEIEVLNYDDIKNGTAPNVEVGMTKFVKQDDGTFKPMRSSGFIVSKSFKPAEIVCPKEEDEVLKFNFVDVQQGDGSVIETPKGKVVVIDGGDNVMFARYLAARFRKNFENDPQKIDCILVTHGDADHFEGLIEISESETHKSAWKRLFINPERVYHNGLVKRPGKDETGKKRTDEKMLGATQTVTDPVTNKDILLLTELVDSLLDVEDKEMNGPFLKWKKALKEYNDRRQKNNEGDIKFRHLKKGDDDAFDFLKDENIEVKILAPIPTRNGNVEGLKFLGDPPEGPRIGHESLNVNSEGFSGKSASHTINGHSIVFRLKYGHFSFLFTGDLNDEAGRILVRESKAGNIELRSEVFKVPHHGSADFSGALLKEVSPVISIISSGDENAQKEFIHPRATIMGALGRHSRLDEPLIFVTELVAFFTVEGYVRPEFHALKDDICEVVEGIAQINEKAKNEFFAFSRSNYGIVKVRTNGKRLLVYTNSGQDDLKEAYAYEANSPEDIQPAEVRKS